MAPQKILFVFTSADKTLRGNQTGWFLPEAAHPYYTLAAKYDIDFAAPAGPNPPVDESSVKNFKDDESVKFLADSAVQEKLRTAKKLTEVNVDDYIALFYPGGHGPVLDLATDAENIKLANQFVKSGKLVSAVCHGPAALVGVTDAAGNSIFKGKEATCFANSEEEAVEKVDDIPFLVESKITDLGGKYVKAANWGVKVVVDGKLITGQNPASAKPLGEAILKALESGA